MSIQTIPGQTGYLFKRVSSMDKRAIGKLTDSNHLESIHAEEPYDYDKKIISLYTQTSLFANDFLEMVNKSKPFYIDGASDSWKWEIEKPYQFPQILSVPDSTLSQSRIGIDSKSFELILDTSEFSKNAVVILGDKKFGPNIYAVTDPIPYERGFLQSFTLISTNPQESFVNRKWLYPGVNVQLSHNNIGEFDTDLGGLRKLADKLIMFETLGSGDGIEHSITAWADDKTLRDGNGRPLDLMVYANKRRNELPLTRNDIKWEPFVEYMARKQMLEQKVSKMIWGKPGTVRTNGERQELKKESAGVYYRMRNSGNYVPYNRGEFSVSLLRDVFGDLFYRREDIQNRKVKLYTNEAGMDAFQNAIKQDATNAGLSFTVGDNSKFIKGEGQNLQLNFAFNSLVSRETGEVTVSHLRELDLPQSNSEYGQNKKSTPVFMVFNVSPNSDGSMSDNIREVRLKNNPSMTWGYIDGRRSHLGAFASKGHSAASKFNGYTMFFDDRYDVFIEDMSRTVLIEELPAY